MRTNQLDAHHFFSDCSHLSSAVLRDFEEDADMTDYHEGNRLDEQAKTALRRVQNNNRYLAPYT